MAIKDYGNLVKLTITNVATKEQFEVMFNPESYTESFSNLYRTKEDVNTGLEEYIYVKTMPQDFKLKLIIDGTGVTRFNSPLFPVLKNMEKSVYDQVNEFLRLAWYPEEGQAKPLLVEWGEFAYHCYLKDVTITYTLFDRKGHPLRAEMDAVFISNPEQMAEQLKNRFELKKGRNFTASARKLGTLTDQAGSSLSTQVNLPAQNNPTIRNNPSPTDQFTASPGKVKNAIVISVS